MVSERPSCISVPVNMMVSPPSWRMPTSKETRVRVDGLSNTIASTLPSSGLDRSPALRRFLRAAASSSIWRRSLSESAERPVKWRGLIKKSGLFGGDGGGLGEAAGTGTDTGERIVDFGVGDGQRRQQANDVVARRHGQQMLVAQRHVHILVRQRTFQAEHEPGTPDAFDDGRELIGDRRQPLLHQK